VKKISLFALLTGLVLIWTGCTKPTAFGDPEKVWIFVDEPVRGVLEPALRAALEKRSITPQEEPWLNLEFVAGDTFTTYLHRRNLLFVGAALDCTWAVSRYVRGLLGEATVARVKNGESLIFRKRDALARHQLAVVLAGPDPQSLATHILDRDSTLFRMYFEFVKEAVRREQFSRYERKDLSRRVLEKLQVKLRIPHDYQVVNERLEEGLIRFRRFYPDRWAAVWVREGLDSLWRDPGHLLDLRDSLGTLFYNPTYVERDPDFFRCREVMVNGHRGMRLEGLWGTFEYVGGGPYIMTVFPDTLHGRTVVVDGAVLAPGKAKIPFLWQLLAINETYGETAP